MPPKRKRSKKSTIKLSGLTTLIIAIGCMIFVYTETQSLLGVGLAAVLVSIGSIVALVGFIPFGIGPAIYHFLIWPWLLQNTVQNYAIQMPTTLFIISTYTVILSIICTIMSSLIILFLHR